MNKEMYEALKSELVVFDLEEVYMLTLESKNDGENKPFPGTEEGEGDWDV